jgi:hypothetical protein
MRISAFVRGLRAELRLLSYPIALVPIAAGFLYVALYGVNVPVQDDWGTVITLARESAGTLSLSDLFSQHNEQRIFFPRLVEIGLAKVNGYSPITEMYVIEASFLAALAALLVTMRRTLGRDALLLLPVVAYLVFSFRQSETMLLGFNISFAFVEAFGVIALAMLWISGRSLGRRQTAAFAGALAAATVAAYSSSQGLAVWPAGLLPLWLAARQGNRKKQIALWSSLGVGEWILYFVSYKSIPGHPSSTYAFRHPLPGLKYFLSLFGASLNSEPTRALVYGLILVGLSLGALVLTTRAREGRRMSFWIALLAYSALMMLLITIGRSGFGVNQGLSSRYSSFSGLGVIALLGLLVRRAHADRSRAAIGFLGATIVLVALSVPGTISDGIRSGRHRSSSGQRAAYILYTYRSEPDALLRDIFQPSPALVRGFAPFLEHKRYVVFAAARPPVRPAPPTSPVHLRADAAPSSCALDSINGAPAGGRPLVSLDRGFVVFRGWCLDPGNSRLAGGVYITLDDHYFPAYYGEARPDVADFFHRRRLVSAGFEAAVRLNAGPAGAHIVAIVALSPDRKRYYQPNPTVGFEVR